MSEHTGLINSYQLLITAACTNTDGKMKTTTLEQLTGAHLYLNIANSGYPFHGYSGGMASLGLSELTLMLHNGDNSLYDNADPIV